MKYLLIDSREKPKATKNIVKYFDEIGLIHESTKLLFGDYMDFNKPEIVIDRKQNIAELAKNCTSSTNGSDGNCNAHRRQIPRL